MANPTNPEERFWPKVDKNGPIHPVLLTPCWNWVAGKFPNGYGQFFIGSRKDASRTSIRAHRFSWELHHGRIPDGLLVCHHCDNRLCCNPGHHFLGDHLANIRDRDAKNRWTIWNKNITHCKHGHEFTVENTYRPPSREGSRACRECHRTRQRKAA